MFPYNILLILYLKFFPLFTKYPQLLDTRFHLQFHALILHQNSYIAPEEFFQKKIMPHF